MSETAGRALIGLLALVWVVGVLLHLDLALRGRLSWAPIYVQPAAERDALPRVVGLWADAPEDPERPRPGDAVVRVGDAPAAGMSRLAFLAAVYTAADDDYAVALRVERGGRELEARLPLVPYNAPWSFAPLILCLGACAALLYARRGDVPAARAAALALVTYSLHWSAFLSGGGWRTTVGVFVCVVALALTGPLTLIAVPLFEDPAARWRMGWRWLFLVLGPLHLSWQLGFPLPGAWALPGLLAAYAALAAAVLVTLAQTYRRGDRVVRRQLRWILLGFYLALAPIAAAAVAAAWEPRWRPLYEWSLLGLLLIPLALTVALTRYNLFDVDRLISATASYSVMLVVLLSVGLLAMPAAASVTGRVSDLDPQVVQVALAIGLAAGLVFGGNAARPRLEAWFFRERAALDRGARELREAVQRFDAPGPLFELLGDRLVTLLRLSDCAIYVRTGEVFVPLFVRGAAVPPAFDPAGRLAPLLDEAAEPIEAGKWRRWGQIGLLTELEFAQLEGLDAQLLVGIPGEKGVAGFACLGEKGSGDVYTSVDRALLEGLFSRVGMQLERFDARAIRDAERDRAQRLAGYVPAAVREQLLSETTDAAPGEREVSVLFVDIRGYTTLSEGLSPDEIFRVVNAYTTAASRVIESHGGWVVEFQGDGLMAVFGAPRVRAEKERRATEAALDLVREVQGGIEEIPDVPLRIGVGVATGSAYVGSVQSSDRKIWCVIGNTTSLAARLQSMTRDMEASVVIDDLTHQRGGDAAAGFSRRDEVRVKGRSTPVTVHSV